MTDKDIINYFTHICPNNTKRILKNKIKKLDENNKILIYLKERYKDFVSYEESLYRIINNIEIKDNCPICGKPISFGDFKYGFMKTCDNKECIKQYKKINTSFNKKEVQEKCKQTIQEKYGVDNPFNIPEVQEKCVKNVKSEQAKQKRINTLITKYGVDNIRKSDYCKQKIKQTLKERYGHENYRNIDKYQQTCLKKYGKLSYQSTDEFKRLISDKISSNECLEKRKQTSLLRYNIANYNNQEKRYITQKKNNTFNTSKPEDQSYVLLKEKYSNVKRQYRSKLYPFNCDFYITDLDLYIECNYHWTHGFHPYNSNSIKDQNKIELWKSKQTKYYNSAISTWTDLDIRKRNIAKENKLNYIEFWNINELKEWLNK